MPRLTDDEVRQRYGHAPDARVVRTSGPAGEPLRLTPDSFTLHQVESALEWATWERPVVVAGSKVLLSVQGAFGGEGSPVEVTLRDARNRVVGRGAGPLHRDRATVAVEINRRTAAREPDGVLCAADVRLTELGIETVSAPLLVLPFAELRDARWSADDARDGDDVTLSCRLSGSPAGVERLGRETAEVEVLRGAEADGAEPVFEPVVTLRVPVTDGRITVRWRVGYDPGGKAQIATQAEFDAAAQRSGRPAGRYARPAWRFRVRLAGLVAEGPEMGYRDHAEFAWDPGADRPAARAAVEVRLADGTVRQETLGDDGRLRLDDVPPGPVEAVFGHDPGCGPRSSPPSPTSPPGPRTPWRSRSSPSAPSSSPRRPSTAR